MPLNPLPCRGSQYTNSVVTAGPEDIWILESDSPGIENGLGPSHVILRI